jgi:hypothetical protein
MFKKSRILAGSKFSHWGGLCACICIGFFYAYTLDIAVFNPRSVVVMVIVSPCVDFDNGKGNTALLLLPVLKFKAMSKNTQTSNDERRKSVLSELPESSVPTLESWFDPDLEILQDHTNNLSETLCYLSLYLEDCTNDLKPGIQACMVKLSHLFVNLKSIQK